MYQPPRRNRLRNGPDGRMPDSGVRATNVSPKFGNRGNPRPEKGQGGLPGRGVPGGDIRQNPRPEKGPGGFPTPPTKGKPVMPPGPPSVIPPTTPPLQNVQGNGVQPPNPSPPPAMGSGPGFKKSGAPVGYHIDPATGQIVQNTGAQGNNPNRMGQVGPNSGQTPSYGTNPMEKYGGKVNPFGQTDEGGPMGGQPQGLGNLGGQNGPGPKPGVTDQWLKKQMQNYQGGIDSPGQYSNWSLDPNQMKRLTNQMQEGGLGRKGINFMLNNQGWQAGIGGGIDRASDNAFNKTLTPEHIKWMMKNQGGGLSGDSANVNQQELFAQFPELWEQYVGGMMENNPNAFGGSSMEEMRRRYDQVNGGGAPTSQPGPAPPPPSTPSPSLPPGPRSQPPSNLFNSSTGDPYLDQQNAWASGMPPPRRNRLNNQSSWLQ